MNKTRKLLIDVSFKLFMQKNFKEVTIKEIVKDAGVSQGAFFHYFQSKEQLFTEIIDNSFSTVIGGLNKLNKDSLCQFYHDYINYTLEILYGKNYNEDNAHGFNYISFIFDALKLFPDFKKNLQEAKDAELNAWNQVVKNARNNGEIKSDLDDELIAKMFIHSADGIALRNIFMESSSEDAKNTLLSLWDSFYEKLKV